MIKPKFISLQIIDRKKDEIVTDIESILRAVISLQKTAGSAFKLNETQKAELMLMQNLYKFGRLDKKTNWFSIQPFKFDQFINILAQLEQVIDASNNKRLVFITDTPWQLLLAVNVSLVGNVLLSLHWKRPDNNDTE